MRKWVAVIGTGAAVIGLGACSNVQAPTTEEENENPAQEAPEETKSASEVYAEAVEASQQVESLRAQSNTEQQMKMQPDGMEIDMTVDSEMEMTYEPLAFHQRGETSIVSEDIDNNNPMLTEMYMTEEGLYMHETSVDMWLKMPEEMHGNMQSIAGQQSADPARQLDELGAFEEDFVLEETDEAYILTLDASGDEFQELTDEQLEKTLGQMEIEAPLAPEDLEVHAVNYVITLNKENYLLDRMEVDMELDVDVRGEMMAIQSQMQVDYSDYNAIEPIEIPPEVLQQAQELEF
ncbi:hypothetical protein KQ939_10515 [Planococcus sp. CP5-4]|uniref:DUF6612 family protein n=1 Tax=unclassified Planococcus (in: firmicutes) TaxID=2662419 RepID=UPI001C215904|nr:MULTISPECIES: DUF6612 family protein [unclassified Planococcus (in: firmicutes)]MBU9672362.1 hypothetical protein [Planococcus sp. CP5-4_YE]MBV0909413.1 hypothetical protein [Planococcus sp. CP5-4_UN]MBW6064142.1 hypothetical protein [Planococcus sp. CP5-4]